MKHRILIITVTTAIALVWGLLVVVVGSTAAAQTTPSADARQAVEAAVAWLVDTHQNDDGGYSSFSAGAGQSPSDVGGTVDALLALAAGAGQIDAPINYLQQNGDAVAAYASTDGSTAGKLVMALVAAGQDPRSFVGHNFVISLTNHLSPTGQFNVTNAFGQSLALLGLSAADEPAPPAAVTWLIGQQAADGSWDDGFGTAANPDATAMAVMALVAARESDSVAAAADFLAQTQLPTGGWEYAAGFGENANSTALAVQALQALGEDVATPLGALLAWQGESGAFQADFGSGRMDDFFTTVQALPAAAGQAYPVTADTAPATASSSNTTLLIVAALAVLVLAAGAFWYSRRRSLR